MRKLAVFVTLALIMASCSTIDSAEPDPAPAGISPVRSDVPFEPSAPTADIAEVAGSDLAFTVDLLEATADGSNLFVSPLSITTALGMLEAGARGETLDEISSTLHETLVGGALHDARGSLVAGIESEGEKPANPDAEPFTMRSVNSLWLQHDFDVLDGYLDTLAGSYDAGLFLVDYVNDPEGARTQINDWVEERTEDRIRDLIPAGTLGALTRLVLTNAVYFKAAWMEQFDPSNTTDGPFTRSDGSQVEVPLMRTAEEFLYHRGDGFQAVWLPYWGGASMMLILPDGSVDEFLAGLESGVLDEARNERSREPFAELTLPTFEFESELRLNDVLRQLGMESAFVPPPGPGTADFTGITSTPELYVSDVIHKTFVAVDEEGTEAAAATAIVMRATAAPVGEPITLRFDRPFLFLIQDDSTGAPLFAGIVEDPA